MDDVGFKYTKNFTQLIEKVNVKNPQSLIETLLLSSKRNSISYHHRNLENGELKKAVLTIQTPDNALNKRKQSLIESHKSQKKLADTYSRQQDSNNKSMVNNYLNYNLNRYSMHPVESQKIKNIGNLNTQILNTLKVRLS